LAVQDRRVALPTGLRVHGASWADARYQHFISGYFRPGIEIRPGMTVLDVGANIGLFSLEVLRRCGGNARLLAFEPAPDPFAHLERNIHEVFPDTDAQLYRCGLAAHSGEATLYYRPRASPTSSLVRHALGDPREFADAMLRDPPAEYEPLFSGRLRKLPRPVLVALLRAAGWWSQGRIETIPCRLTTISSVLREREIGRVDFLKVDVEGVELEVLRGIDAQDWPKIQQLAIEVHDLDQRVATVRAMLERAGFDHPEVQQDWPFEGTNVYMVRATRSSPDAALERGDGPRHAVLGTDPPP
jgi:FkbM family methyltransferase